MKKSLIALVMMFSLFGMLGCNQNGTEDPDDNNDPGDDDMNGVKKGLHDRPYPTYYEEGIPLVDDAYVVYINWDGFARYYLDEFFQREIENEMPTLKKLMSEGVFFDDLRATMPSVTNALQNMILSGGTSAITKNVYRYYNRQTNTVVQQARENAAETIVTAAVKQNISQASVHFYLAEPSLTNHDPSRLYITSDNSIPAVVERGSYLYGDHFARMEQATRLIKGEPVKVGGIPITVSELPRLITIYADDLDGIGHNEQRATSPYIMTSYGYPWASSEVARIENVMKVLKDMDQKLGDFIQAAKDAGIYDKMTFFLTTDHGMTPFGAKSTTDDGDYIFSKLGSLRNVIQNYDSNFRFEMVAAGNSPRSDTNVVGVGANLNMQLTWKDGITEEQLQDIKAVLEQQPYVGIVHTREELREMGYWVQAADMVVTPAEQYFFSSSLLTPYLVRAQHDSLLDSSNHVVGWIWGKGIKENVIFEEKAYNFDFGLTIAAALGLVLPEANGIVLDVFKQDE